MSSITGGRTWLAGLVIVPALVAFLTLDAGVGMIVGVATAATIIVVAARMKDEVPIEIATPGPSECPGLLVLAVSPLDEPELASALAAILDDPQRGPEERRVLVTAPARSSRLDRWADDLERGQFESQRILTVSLATLAAAGIEAEGRVGDGDLVRAAEDTLRSFPASEVVVVADEGALEREVEELARRLQVPLHRIS